jgi:hypothetical protein
MSDLPKRLEEMAKDCERTRASGEFIRTLREAANALQEVKTEQVEERRRSLEAAHEALRQIVDARETEDMSSSAWIDWAIRTARGGLNIGPLLRWPDPEIGRQEDAAVESREVQGG